MSEVWIGIDVSKEGFDVAVRPGDQAWSVRNDQVGIKVLTRQIKKLSPQRIVLEASKRPAAMNMNWRFGLGGRSCR